MKFLILAVVAVILFLGVKYMDIRKDLVAERQTIDTDWTQVDAALQQRAGVVPELAQAVQADAPAEAGAIRALTDARNVLDSARSRHERIVANARLDTALARLMLLVENYPKLESSKKYDGLLDTLKDAEYQIAVARRKYNEAVEHYNARIDLFPNNIVASLARLGKIDAYFQTPAI